MSKSAGETEATDEFMAGRELFALSPAGLLTCGLEWLRSAKIPGKHSRGFDPQAPGFVAAGRALSQHPLTFIGADGSDWKESGRDAFWRLFFNANANGSPVLDFAGFVGGIGKKDLAAGARNMLILAAKERDAKSFEELLAMGAARRSKLVLFSAYQNGGKAIAEKVKQPTDLEAHELLSLGSAMGRWSYGKAVVHDWEGFDWLMGRSLSKMDASKLASIGANSTDPDLLPNALAKYADRIKSEPSRRHVDKIQVEVSAEDVAKSAALSFASAGSAPAAKAWADKLGAWAQLAGAGLSGPGSLACASWPGQEAAQGVDFAAPARRGFTMQMAACMSGSADTVAWMRRAYEESGFAWLGAGPLRAGLGHLIAPYSQANAHEMALAAAVALSESADLRHGIKARQDEPGQAAEAAASANRRRGGL